MLLIYLKYTGSPLNLMDVLILGPTDWVPVLSYLISCHSPLNWLSHPGTSALAILSHLLALMDFTCMLSAAQAQGPHCPDYRVLSKVLYPLSFGWYSQHLKQVLRWHWPLSYKQPFHRNWYVLAKCQLWFPYRSPPQKMRYSALPNANSEEAVLIGPLTFPSSHVVAQYFPVECFTCPIAAETYQG